MPDPALKPVLLGQDFFLPPGFCEQISARVADRIGFDAFYVTGYGTVASTLGLPDVGLATCTDMPKRTALICERVEAPVIADADTGYGGQLYVHHTVCRYERAGAIAVQLRDHGFPRKCGYTPGRRAVPLTDMLRKIEVAAITCRSDDLLIIAKTDFRTAYGLDEATRRGHKFARAEPWADIVFVELPYTAGEVDRIAA